MFYERRDPKEVKACWERDQGGGRMAKEYIERDQILGYMDLVVIHARGVAGNDSMLKKVTDIVENMRDLVAEAPAADVAPVVHAEWIVCGDGDNVPWMCSHCGKTTAHKYKTMYGNYCPNCGARMDGD